MAFPRDAEINFPVTRITTTQGFTVEVGEGFDDLAEAADLLRAHSHTPSYPRYQNRPFLRVEELDRDLIYTVFIDLVLSERRLELRSDLDAVWPLDCFVVQETVETDGVILTRRRTGIFIECRDLQRSVFRFFRVL